MNLYTKNKIYLSFASLGGCLIFFTFLLFNQGMNIKNVSTDIDARWVPSIVASNAMNTLISDYRATIAQHINSTNASEMEENEQLISNLNNAMTTWQSKYDHLIGSDNERQLFQAFVSSYNTYLTLSRQSLLFSQNHEHQKAIDQFRRNRNAFTDLSQKSLHLIDFNNTGSHEAINQGNKIFSQAQTICLTGGVLLSLLLISVAVVLYHAPLKHPNHTEQAAIRKKSILLYLVIIFAFWLFDGLFYQQLERANQQISALNTHWLPQIVTINNLNSKISHYRVTEALLVLSNTAEEIERWTNQFKQLSQDIEGLEKSYQASLLTDNEQTIYAAFLNLFGEYQAAIQHTTELIQTKQTAETSKQIKHNNVIFADFRINLTDLIMLNERGWKTTNQIIDSTLETLKIISLGGGGALLIVLIICATTIQAWFHDLPLDKTSSPRSRAFSIKLKLRMAFFGMVITFMLFGLLINKLMLTVNHESHALAANWLPSIIMINTINTLTSDYRIAEAQHILAQDTLDKLFWDKNLLHTKQKLNQALHNYQALTYSDEERDIYHNLLTAYEDYQVRSEKMLTLSRQQVALQITLPLLQNNQLLFNDLSKNLNTLVTLNSEGGFDSAQRNQYIYQQAQLIIFAVILIILLTAILFMLIFDKNISVALQQLTAAVRCLARGEINFTQQNLAHRHDEIGEMAAALYEVSQILRNVSKDSTDLISAAKAGILSAKVEASRHPGEFAHTAEGMNTLIATLSEPLGELVQIMQNLALGDLEARMHGQYEGELRILKTNVNRSLDALVNLLTELGSAMQLMAAGDLRSQLSGNYQGEFSVLKANTNKTIAQLTQIMSKIIINTADAAAAISQASSSSRYVAEQSAQQLSAIEYAQLTLAETAVSIHAIANKGKENDDLARVTAQSTLTGQDELTKLIELIQHIDAEYLRIEKITDEITRIADKTHLLSLNAGLEAMRAGEHGEGFGFIAQQIGRLAEEASVSARTIGDVINSSGQNIRLSVHATLETQAAMNAIANAAQNNALNVASISVAIAQQSEALQSLNERVKTIRVSSEATAAASEQISTTMAQLAQTIRLTADDVKRFQLTEK
ncbi:MAG: HAMP domain-containing methyl-accepting chemotaxis protein [Methylovulum sp.]|jgi:methyl-accepting chemotaxis protein